MGNTDIDHHVPKSHEGTLEPNKYCRAWNPRREKYCRSRAGKGTSHPGEGRCSIHDGRPVIHGRYSRYANLAPTIQEIFETHMLQADDLLDVAPEISLARALLEDYVRRYEDLVETWEAWQTWWLSEHSDKGTPPNLQPLPIEGVIKMLEKVVKMTHKERQLDLDGAVSWSDFIKYTIEMGKIVRRWLVEEEAADLDREQILRNIKEDWQALRNP